MRLGYCVCAAAANASHPERNRNTALATGVVPLRILAPWRNQYAMLRADFARPSLRERRRARVDFAAGGNVMNRGFGSFVAVRFALHAAPAPAEETWPSRPVKFIVPSSPGGGTDLYARELGQALSDSLKQKFIVDNRPGASGNIGAEAAAKSAPDGYTFLVSANPAIAVNPSLYKNLAYNAERDLVPVARGVVAPLVICVHPSVPARTLAEAGFPGLEIYSSFSVVAPAGTPPAIVQRMSVEIARAMKSPGLAGKLEHHTLIPVFDTPEQFAAHLKKEKAAWAAVIRRNAIVPD